MIESLLSLASSLGQYADVAVDLHGASSPAKFGRFALVAFDQWHRKLSKFIEEPVEHFGQNWNLTIESISSTWVRPMNGSEFGC